jgi:hypothetical protein
MPLIYNKYLNQFIYDPGEIQAIDELKNSPPLANPSTPKTKTNRGQFFLCSPKLPKPSQVGRDSNSFSTWKTNRLAILMTVCGWIGIVLYHLDHPVRFSLIGLFFYLCCDGLSLLLLNGALVLFDLCFDTRERPYLITLKLFSYKYEIMRAAPLLADLERRGFFFRELRRVSIVRFPKMLFLLREKFSYDNIFLTSDFDRLRSRSTQRQAITAEQQLLSEMVRNPETRRRLKYGDPRLQEFLEKFKSRRKVSSIEAYLDLISLFFISIPSEDGIFLAPPILLGINNWTIILFAFLFGFVHFPQYSTINCLRIVFTAMLEIVFILPKYGLLTCIVGHIIFDLFCFYAIIIKSLQEARNC